jgi:hypothetical protein
LTLLKLQPARLKTESSFTADDPWNRNRRTQFTIERYILAAEGSTPNPNTKMLLGSYFYGIRSEIDGVEHMLPESLGHLWRSNRVPAESLPRLLKEMEPRLRKTDFRLQFLTKVHTFVAGFVMVLLVLLAMLGVFAVVFDGGGAEVGVVFASLIGFLFVVFYFALFRPRARRRKQMEWAIAQV